MCCINKREQNRARLKITLFELNSVIDLSQAYMALLSQFQNPQGTLEDQNKDNGADNQVGFVGVEPMYQ